MLHALPRINGRYDEKALDSAESMKHLPIADVTQYAVRGAESKAYVLADSMGRRTRDPYRRHLLSYENTPRSQLIVSRPAHIAIFW